MKITKSQLKQIIKEELGRVIEQDDDASDEHFDKLKKLYFGSRGHADQAVQLATSLGLEGQLADIVDGYIINIFMPNTSV